VIGSQHSITAARSNQDRSACPGPIEWRIDVIVGMS
jgi:hypothetical protein